jgi:hypothetical protein
LLSFFVGGAHGAGDDQLASARKISARFGIARYSPTLPVDTISCPHRRFPIMPQCKSEKLHLLPIIRRISLDTISERVLKAGPYRVSLNQFPK